MSYIQSYIDPASYLTRLAGSDIHTTRPLGVSGSQKNIYTYRQMNSKNLSNVLKIDISVFKQ